MEAESIRAKLRRHRCPSPGKQDFEREIR
jgi:hypothetical protein